MKIFILFLMIFLHLVDDFHLQGCLANLKQKEWWKKNCPHPMYEKDYIISLLAHSFEWTFIMMLPLALVTPIGNLFIVIFILNIIIHSLVDDLKANKKSINLILDQVFHLEQIVITWILVLGV